MDNISYIKKVLINIICILIAVIIISPITLTKYKTKEIEADVKTNPAIFNTVLLGKLTSNNILSLLYIDNDNKMIGQKINTNLVLTENNEVTQSNKELADNNTLKPGSIKELYFTVTNGTTLIDDDSSNQKNNISETDIVYRLNVLTTMNIPLTYKLVLLDKDNNEIKSYNFVSKYTEWSDEVGGYVNILGINSEYTEEENQFTKQGYFSDTSKRILKHIDNNITIHRYKLIIEWPLEETTLKKPVYNIANNNVEIVDVTYDENHIKDKEFMKEIDNIEILISVESYIDKSYKISVTDKTPVIGVIGLSNNYELEKPLYADYNSVIESNNISEWLGKKEIAFNALGNDSNKLTTKEIQAINNSGKLGISTSSNVYSYDFKIRNCADINVTYVDDETSEDPLDGKYVLDGNFGSFNNSYLALGVISNDSIVGKSRLNGYRYFIGVDDNNDGVIETYYGAETNEVSNINADKWVVNKVDGVSEYKYSDEQTFAFCNFYKINSNGTLDKNTQLELTEFKESEYDEHNYTIFVEDTLKSYIQYEKNDSMTIHIYSK